MAAQLGTFGSFAISANAKVNLEALTRWRCFKEEEEEEEVEGGGGGRGGEVGAEGGGGGVGVWSAQSSRRT